MKGPKENETDEKCPVCNSNLFLIQYETKIAYEGDILITTYYCRKCGYRYLRPRRKDLKAKK